MKETYHILEEPLQKSQDFATLKDEGFDFIQQFGGNEWTNLNLSDPGVTILEQVCYALTELGYCNDFPIQDILTSDKGKLKRKDQFYLPNEILTTAPITTQDYQKYLIDGIEEVRNAVIVPIKNYLSSIRGVYMVYLLIDEIIVDSKAKKDICESAFFLLNTSRNLGELFLMPKPLEEQEFQLTGILHVTTKSATTAILKEFSDTINNFIFPRIRQTGYDELRRNGTEVNEIFNGPTLKGGWINTSHFIPKRDKISLFEIHNLLLAHKSLKSISNLDFLKKVKVKKHGILICNIEASVRSGKLKIYHNGRNLFPVSGSDSKLLAKNSWKSSALIPQVASISLNPSLPKGKYREINDYYSIQNTFPEIYGVGASAPLSDHSEAKTAQSRQLKGYLTLFDQVIANQFSQLANIDKLFSFKNSTSGIPSERVIYDNTKDSLEKKPLSYPAPYTNFSPTYFYQSLYDIPYIRPLLKQNDALKFSTAILSNKDLDEKSWKGYKKLPYNGYIRGLKRFMEDEKTSLTRRNEILDHLLARHGESPLFINAIIEDSIYSGGRSRDLVIFKSLYLQNLGTLSYYKQKAYNFIGARGLKTVSKKSALTKDLEKELNLQLTKDFIFRTSKVDDIERLKPQDFTNHSTFALKSSLLLGLRFQYQAYILECHKAKTNEDEIRQSLWMIQKQRGFILVETNLLLQAAQFEIFLYKNTARNHCWKLGTQSDTGVNNLEYGTLMMIDAALQDCHKKSLKRWIRKGSFQTHETSPVYIITPQKNNKPPQDKFLWPIPDTPYTVSVKAKWKNGAETYMYGSCFNNAIELIFPRYITEFTTASFADRIGLLFENTLPVQFGCRYERTSRKYYHTLEFDELESFRTSYTNWHDRLIFKQKKDSTYLDQLEDPELLQSAGRLAAKLIALQTNPKTQDNA